MTAPLVGPDQLSGQNPWPGLRAFTEGDRDFFFGREHETTELLGLIDRSPVVVLYGQSGLGKTSLLQAGLIPELRRRDYLPIRLVLDHGEAARPLAEQLKSALATEFVRAGVTGPAPAGSETLWEYFHRRDVDHWGPGNRLLTPVIILDQFEEVFTLGQASERAIARVAAFSADLESVLEHRAPPAIRDRLEAHPDEAIRFDSQRQAVKFLVTLREDFLPHLDTWRARIPSLLPTRFRLEPMSGARALTVVQNGGRDLVTPAVAHDIVDFVSTSQRAVSSRPLEQRDVQPALLSVVCEELNRRRLQRNPPESRISPRLLRDEQAGIIESFYARAFEGIDPCVREWVEDRLLTESGYRSRAAQEDAVDPRTRARLSAAEFNMLIDRRVLHREDRGGVAWLELTHDLLTDPAARSRADRKAREQSAADVARIRALRARRIRWSSVAALVVVVAFGFLEKARSDAARLAVEAIKRAHEDSVTLAKLQQMDAIHHADDIARAKADTQAAKLDSAVHEQARVAMLAAEFGDDFKRLVPKLRDRAKAEKDAFQLQLNVTAGQSEAKLRAQLQAMRDSSVTDRQRLAQIDSVACAAKSPKDTVANALHRALDLAHVSVACGAAPNRGAGSRRDSIP